MNRKIMIINLFEPSLEALHKLNVQYEYAAQNKVDEIVLFVENICEKGKETAKALKDIVNYIPCTNKEKNVKTYLLLDSAISYYLSVNDYKKILGDRTDIEIILNCIYEAIYNRSKIYFHNYTLNEVEDESIFLEDCLYVYITYSDTGYDKRAAAFGNKIVYVGPFSEENQYRSVIVEVKEGEPIFGVVFASECGYNDSCIFM